MKNLAAILAFIIYLMPHAHSQVQSAYVEGEVLVTFKPVETTESAGRALKRKSLNFAERYTTLSAKRRRQTGLVREKSKTTAQLIAQLKDDPSVESVEPNYLRWFNSIPNDTRFTQQWSFNNTGQTVNGTTGTAGADVSYLAAQNLSRSPSSEIVVAVVDSGVDVIHPDLAANIWINPLEIPRNGVDDDANGYADDINGYDFASADADPSDSGDHGTHVAGTIAAPGDNMAGVIGIHDSAKILPLKVSTNGTTISTSAAISAIQYATALKNRGVNIVAINASYGGGGYSAAELAAINAAGNAGIMICAAAGNSTANNDTITSYPASYRTTNMIVVAATDQNDALASYSNFGATTVDLAAPGSNIISTEPSSISLQVGSTTYSFTPLAFSGITTGLSASVIDCGNGNSAAQFPATVNGNIALIQRGTETFRTKVTNAMAAGARAAIIYNNVAGAFSGTLQIEAGWIPSYAISLEDGQAIKAALPSTGSLVLTANYQFMDGTSMATPHVAGAVSFAALNFPADTVAQRRARILAAVDSKPALSGKVITTGRLNLLKIVDANVDGIADWQLQVTTTALPLAIHGVSYSQTLTATGGSMPYTWSLESGALPSGFSLSSQGVLSGISRITGTFNFSVKVTDLAGASSTTTLTLDTAPFGPADHFTWDFVPGDAYANTDFAVKFSARDSDERLVTTASGEVTLSASGLVFPSSVTLSNGEFVGYLRISSTGPLTATQSAVSGSSSAITVLSLSSSAGDGIPDSWKSANGLALTPSIAGLDSDSDGQTNLQEFHAGTLPTAAGSVFKVSSAHTDSTTQVSINFPAVRGKLYRASRSSNLAAWTPESSRILATTDGLLSIQLPLQDELRSYFRVEIVP
jgi:subtilisin family serine protease